ncbi:type VI secretion system tip protein VgrG [Massilia arenosa]|uniref:Type VI secretion system tip protein VgrG n=1 Tax=Zemynaea arenosa TaxID=2561931 RepID=A0A4Y9RQZ4_9BURK|nr:type VI secretion system Vgr family protein [Massilia arenosa]TFW11530.1 type VI secretion system tip protein VgrG [Massilia arenosa]
MAENSLSFSALLEYALQAQNRPLSLVLSRQDGSGEDELLPQKVIGREQVCGGFEYRILCLSSSATSPLKSFIGVPAELRIVTDRGDLRRVCGIIRQASSGQSDGALATYQIVITDALAIMEARTNTRVFRNMNELDVVRVLTSEWRERNTVLRRSFELDIDAALAARQIPKREFIMQHNESDAGFIRRLLQRRGISWFFRSGLPERAGQRSNDQAVGHALVLFQDTSRLRANAAGTVRFHRDAATEQRDSVTAWSAVRSLQPGNIALQSWDYKKPASTDFMATSSPVRHDQGDGGNSLAGLLENYEVAPPHFADSALDLTDLGNVHASHFAYEAKVFQGEGGVRDLAVGEWIGLSGQPEIDTHPQVEREFVITSLLLAAQNNLPKEVTARVHRLFNHSGWGEGDYRMFENIDGEPIRFKSRFTCVRRGSRIVPPQPVLPRTQLQSAIVVGPPNEEIWCDELGRVKVRFPATRPEDHAHAAGAGASNSDIDSAWVRVATSWAGNGPGSTEQCGTRYLPRIGSEVLIDFSGGDPDKPVIIGQLYNGSGVPPAFHRESPLPGTKYQSGLRSREIRGARGSQLRFDDTTGQISAQLASDHASSELNLGFMTEPRADGSSNPRGEGAELRTSEAIALHAARGIFLSAWKLLGTGTTKGSQLEREEFLSLMRECGELFASLGNYAGSHNGLPIDAKDQDDLLGRFEKWEDGSNTKPKAPEPREPVIGVTSPAGIGFASSQAIVSYSARNIDTVAQQHLQMVAGQRVNLNAGNGLSLFAQSGGMHAIAHNGKLILQSQHGDTELAASDNVKITATKGTVTIAADKLLFVTTDGSFIKLGDGPPVIGSKHQLKFHAPQFTWDGPETMSSQLPRFDDGGTDLQFAPHYYPYLDGGVPASGLHYELESAAAASSNGVTDGGGKTTTLTHGQMQFATINLVRKDEQS